MNNNERIEKYDNVTQTQTERDGVEGDDDAGVWELGGGEDKPVMNLSDPV